MKTPFSQRFNWRVLVFVAIVGLPLAFLLYWLIEATLTGGISAQGDLTVVDLKAMSSFEMDQETATDRHIPQKWRDLNGKKVKLTGEMYVGASAGDEARQFDLVYSISKCCVTPNPKVQHFVRSTAAKGKVPVYGGLVDVVGVLRVGIERDEGKIVSVYRLEVQEVRPLDERSGVMWIVLAGAVVVPCWLVVRRLRMRAAIPESRAP